MAAFQSASSSCAIDALTIVCKRSGTPANIVLQTNEEDDAHQTYMLILGGEANRSDLEGSSSLAVLWAALVKVARTIDIGPPSDSLPDFSSLGSDEGRFYGAFLTTFEVLMENRPADGAYLVRNLVETFVSSGALANADKILLQLIREYKDLFPFAYTFNRRANKYPKSSFDAVEKYFRTTRASKPSHPSGATSTEDDVSMLEDGFDDDDGGEDDDTLSSSYPMENFPVLAAPSIAPLKPYSLATDRDGASPSDRNYDYSPHQASIVNAYYNNPAGEGETTRHVGGYSRYMHSLEEDEDSDVDNSAVYLQQIQLRKSKKRMTRMKKKKTTRTVLSTTSSMDSVVTAETSPASVAKTKSVTFNDENNEVMEISVLEGSPPASPRPVTAVSASVSGTSTSGGALSRPLPPPSSRPTREDDVEDFVSDDDRGGGGLDRTGRGKTADRHRGDRHPAPFPSPPSSSSYAPFRLNSVSSGPSVIQHSKLSDSESSLELSDKERDRREERRTVGRGSLRSVLSDEDDEDRAAGDPWTRAGRPAGETRENAASQSPGRYRYHTTHTAEEALESLTSTTLSAELGDSLHTTTATTVSGEASPSPPSPIPRSHAHSVSLSVSSLTIDGGEKGEKGAERAAAIQRVKQNIAKMRLKQQQQQAMQSAGEEEASPAPPPVPAPGSLSIDVPPLWEGGSAAPAPSHQQQEGEEKEEKGLPWEESDDELCEPVPEAPRAIPSLSALHLEALCPLSQHRSEPRGEAPDVVSPVSSAPPPPRKVIAWDSTRALLPIRETPPATRFSLTSRSSTSSPRFPLAQPLDEDPFVVMRSLSQPVTLSLAQSYSRYSLQEAPLTAVHLARLADLSDLAKEVGVIMEAHVHKQSNFMKMWQKRFLVLRESEENFCELCFYKQAVPSAWGNVPLRQKACIPILDIAAVETVDSKSAQGKEFVIRFVSKQPPQSRPLSFAFWRKSSSLSSSNLRGLNASSTLPGGSSGGGGAGGDEEDARSDYSGSAASDKHYGTKIPFLYLQAEDAEMRLLWVTMLNKVLRLAHDACQ